MCIRDRVVAAVLLYGNAYLVMAVAIVVSMAEFSKIKAAESLAWSPRLSNFTVTLLAILASSIFTGESLLNINTPMQKSINGKLESAESDLIEYQNNILQTEKEINILVCKNSSKSAKVANKASQTAECQIKSAFGSIKQYHSENFNSFRSL